METALSSCQFQTILLNPCEFFSLRPNLQARRCTHINSESEDDSDVPRHGRGGSKRVSLSQYHAFQLHKRDGIFSPLLHAGRLCQEYCVDAWVCTESNVFNGYGQIKQSYEQTVTMGFKMQSEQGLRKMRIDWDVKSSSLRPSLALLDI